MKTCLALTVLLLCAAWAEACPKGASRGSGCPLFSSSRSASRSVCRVSCSVRYSAPAGYSRSSVRTKSRSYGSACPTGQCPVGKPAAAKPPTKAVPQLK